MKTRTIQWYPGHIAKAEKQLNQNLKKVDLVIEVRDARIPKSTSHPHLERWIKGKQHLLVMNRKDMICSEAIHVWDKWFRERGETPLWCNAKDGTGVKQLQDAAVQTGQTLNKRRQSRGMKSRPVRVLTLGFPNVGKSALINRLVRKKVVISARKAGVTRSLQWVRLGQDLDLLDAPGVLPPRFEDQEAALRLALCDDIGEAAYDVESVAISLLIMLHQLAKHKEAGINIDILEKRYGVEYGNKVFDANQWLSKAAERHTSGNNGRMAQRVLDDFRKSLLGQISLELP